MFVTKFVSHINIFNFSYCSIVLLLRNSETIEINRNQTSNDAMTSKFCMQVHFVMFVTKFVSHINIFNFSYCSIVLLLRNSETIEINRNQTSNDAMTSKFCMQVHFVMFMLRNVRAISIFFIFPIVLLFYCYETSGSAKLKYVLTI